MNDMLNKRGMSKRHVTVVLYGILVALNKKLGLDISMEELMTLGSLIGLWVGGESYTKGKQQNPPA